MEWQTQYIAEQMILGQSEETCNKVDMSPEAVDRRLRELGQLYKLGMAIQQAKHIGKTKDFIHLENKADNSVERKM